MSGLSDKLQSIFAKLKNKGKLSEEELRSGVRAAEKLGARLYTVSRYGLFGAERAIVVFEKVSPVPPGFPRRFKRIVSDPL